MIRLHYCWLLFVSFIGFHLSYCQDTLNTGSDEQIIDTVVIYKEPVILTKTVYFEEEKKERNNSLWLVFDASPVYTINHFRACPGFETYLDKLKETTSSSWGYSFGANIVFLYKNLFLSTGIGYLAFREKFIYQSSAVRTNQTNIFHYANVPLLIGYRMVNTKKFQAIVSGGAIIGKLLSVRGKTISEDDLSVIQDIDDVRKYSSYNYQGTVKLKFVYGVSTSVLVGIEPYYFADLRSITRSLEPFTQLRNNLAINANLIFVLK